MAQPFAGLRDLRVRGSARPELRLAVMLMLAILVAAALASGFYFPLGERRIRPEHIAAPVLFAGFVLVQRLRKEPAVRIDAFSVLAVAWVLANAVSSWLHAPQPSESFVHVVRFGFLAAAFLTVANLPPLRGADWGSRVRLWLALGSLELMYGLLTWVLALYADIWLSGTFVESTLSGISLQGTMYERNLFGIFAATLLAVASYSLLAQRSRSHPVVASPRFLVAVCVLAGSTMVLSLTRSAWLATVIAGPVAYLVFDRRLGQADRPLLQVIAALPLLLVLLIATMGILPTPSTEGRRAERSRVPAASGVGDRVATLGRLETDFTVNTRVQDARWALNDWLASPLLGRGTGSFVQIHGIRVGTEAWVSNQILHTLVDTGVVGLAIQLSLFVLIARRAWHTAVAATDPVLQIGLKAMTLGLLVMLIAYQLTDGTWLAVFWIHLALMVNGIYSVRDEQRQFAGATPPFQVS